MGVNLQVLPQKAPGATLIVPFNFTSVLSNGQTISGATTVATVWSGTDTNPSAIVGSTSPSGTVVNQTLTGGVAGNIYKVTVTATASDGSVQVLMGYLAVVADPL